MGLGQWLERRLSGEQRLNDLFDSFLRSGYDEYQALQVVIDAASRMRGVTEQGARLFLAQPRVWSIVQAHENDDWVRSVIFHDPELMVQFPTRPE